MIKKSQEQSRISSEIKNSGMVESDEVVQMYVRSKVSRVKRPLKELKGVSRIHVLPGENKITEFILPLSDISFWDVTRDRF